MERHAEPEPWRVNRDNSSSFKLRFKAPDDAAARAANPEAEEAKPAAVGTGFTELTYANNFSFPAIVLTIFKKAVTRWSGTPVISLLSKKKRSFSNCSLKRTVVSV